MEMDLSCQGTVGETIAFDLFYLLAICVHKRLLFIIILIFIIVTSNFWLSVHIFFIFISFFVPYHSMMGWCYIDLALREASQQRQSKQQKP